MPPCTNRRLSVLSTLLPLIACGLERDLEKVKQAAEAAAQTSGSDDTSGQLSTSYLPQTTSSSTNDAGTTGPTGPTGPISDGSTSIGETALDDSTSGGPGASTGPAATCGDGSVGAGEECDDKLDARCHDCVRDRLVFVTSQTVLGNFASEADLDYLCNHLASLAGLIPDDQPSFHAWLSTSTASAADRLYHSPGRYVRTDGAIFALSWDAIVAGDLENPLNVDESRVEQNGPVWTGTQPDGSATPDSAFCMDWRANAFGLLANWGRSDYLDSRWTQWTDDTVNPTDCGKKRALYCFERE